MFQRLFARLKLSNLKNCVANTEKKHLSCACFEHKRRRVSHVKISQESPVAVEGNIMAEQGDGQLEVA